MRSSAIGTAIGSAVTALAAVGARAQDLPEDLPVIGAPTPGGVGYQPAVTEIAHDVHWLSNWVHAIMVLIVIFVVLLIAIVVVRYNRRANPNPAAFTHNTRIEIAWTLVPVLILILIGSFSLPILFKQVEIPEPDLTIKATGYQWYWNHEYPDYEFGFDSFMLPREDLEANGYSEDLYLLATDSAVVVPQGATVRLQTTGGDVIHAWTIPAFGVKMDAVPGRLNEIWFNAEEVGIYFGQCSELCGKDHTYMPITVKVVPEEDYQAWLDWAIAEYGGTRPEDATAEAAPGAASAAETPEAEGEPAEGAEAPAEGEPAQDAEGEPAPDEEAPAEGAPAPDQEAPAEAEPPAE